MLRILFGFVCCSAFFLFGCENKREFPTVEDVATLSNTVVLPTLEHPLPKGKNAIYAASLLFAWEELRAALGGKIKVPVSNKDLDLLNKSKSHRGSLEENEVEKSASVKAGMVKASARFAESLPLEQALDRLGNVIKFDGKPVEAFGALQDDSKLRNSAQIGYYKNDDHFAIMLLTKNKDHELLLYKAPNLPNQSLGHCYAALMEDWHKGSNALKEPKNEWKYFFDEADELAIPLIAFNIGSGFPEMVGERISSSGSVFAIESIQQRTAFILDEKGAEVESVAEVAFTEAEFEEEEKPKPKRLIFDGPFLVALKKANSEHPYFLAFIENTALLQPD
jgi:hypothetical protein